MLIVPSSPSTSSTSSRCSGDALSASISKAMLASCSGRRSRMKLPLAESLFEPLARRRGMTTARRGKSLRTCTVQGQCGNETPCSSLGRRESRGRVEEGQTMRKLGLAAVVAASVAAAGCSTYPDQYGYSPYGYNNGYYANGYNNGYANNGYYGNGYGQNVNGSNVAAGAAVGAVGGAIASGALGGSPVGGAVAGAILGGVLGAAINGHQYYRDTRGYCYYVDQNGQPHYSYDVRC